MLFCLVWTWLAIVAGDEIAQGLAWSWPEGSFLRLGKSSQLLYTHAEVSAGVEIYGLEIAIPNYQCVDTTNSEASYNLTLRFPSTGDVVEALLHLEAENASLFLGPSLEDGYELTFEGQLLLRRARHDVSLGVSESTTAAGTGARDFWLSWHFSQNTATVRLYGGSLPEDNHLLLSYFDPVPPWHLDGMQLWAAGWGTWSLCPAGRARPSLTPSVHQRAMLKLVTTEAQASDCEAPVALHDAPVPGESVWPLDLSLVGENRLASNANFSFMQGGRYKFCYAADASNDCVCVGNLCTCSRSGEICTPSARSFGSCNPFAGATGARSSVLFVDLWVIGVSSACQTEGCLELERWDCFFSLGTTSRAASSCILDLQARPTWQLHGPTAASAAAATWGPLFGADLLQNGARVAETPTFCGGVPSDFFDTNVSVVDLQAASPVMPPVRADVSMAFTVPLCYCSTAPCAEVEHFVQSFGRLYMWVTYICDRDDSCDGVSPSYARVLPDQRFVVKLQCPPGGGCSSDVSNQLKFLEATGAPSRSNWDPSSRCRAAAAAEAALSGGGVRVDFKLWPQRAQLTAPLRTDFHVCYCDAGCDETWNWLQVGVLKTALAVGLSFESASALRFAQKPGTLTLYAGIGSGPYVSNRFQGAALLKLLTLDQVQAGVVSLAEGYEVQKSGRAKLMGGLQQDCGRSDHLVAEGRGETSELSQRLSFPTLQLQAGTLVICYCAQLTDDACTGTWFYLGLLQVSGPQPGHRWVLPTRQKVGLQDLQGWGFRVDDRLRLLDKGSSCSSAPSSSAYKVGCSSNSSCRVALEDETIEVRVANNLLSGAELLEVHVESDSSSILTFSAPIGHLLQDGDAIYLEPESILIDGRGLISMSEDEQFDAMLLAGMAQFQDDPSKFFLQHWHYVQVLAEEGSSDESKRVRIPMGWASDARRAFSFVPGQLQWFRANRLDSEETGAESR
ncbi:unnamed protein product [Durusdinium trenchii]|uniref:Uncharacterized protein n=1 Tax=Durusdinium trenchii TaxID=1381693 RepID=A0ABP0QIQ0_9DINO